MFINLATKFWRVQWPFRLRSMAAGRVQEDCQLQIKKLQMHRLNADPVKRHATPIATRYSDCDPLLRLRAGAKVRCSQSK